jgi:hypothetical protein
MFKIVKPQRQWSDIGLRVLIGTIVATVVLSLFDGILRGPVLIDYDLTTNTSSRLVLVMVTTWLNDFRYLAEQGVYAATLFFAGAKFFETRSIFSIGFDKLDADKVLLKGPDAENVVWIGHRYGNAIEAEAVAAAFAERLKESAA